MADPSPSSEPMNEEQLLANQIHALSLIDFHAAIQQRSVNYAALSYESKSPVIKHISLLDGIALLLIRKPKKEVVATSFRFDPSCFTILWARNDGMAVEAETDYMNRLLQHAKAQTKPLEVLTPVIDYTKAKVISRCQKLAKEHGLSRQSQKLEVQNLLKLDTSATKYHELEQQLKQRKILQANRHLYEFLDNLLRGIARVGQQTSTPNLVKIISHAYELCTQQHKIGDLVNRYHNDKFRKLSDYFLTVCRFQHDVRYLLAKGYKDILFKQIFAKQQPKGLVVYSRAVDALNTGVRHQPAVQKINSFEEQVKAEFPAAHEGPHGLRVIDHCQHAELTLAVHFLDLSFGGTIEIGVSKSSCYWCSLWLDLANQAHSSTSKRLKFVVRASHGKRTDGWLLPRDNLIEKLFINRFNVEFQGIYETVSTGRRRSDSKPLSENEEQHGTGDFGLSEEGGYE